MPLIADGSKIHRKTKESLTIDEEKIEFPHKISEKTEIQAMMCFQERLEQK